METKNGSRDLLKYIFIILAVATVLVNIKSIFTDFGIDSEYAITMSYRMLQGDRMFVEMWEPHQTSAFLCAALMKVYISLTGSLTGVVLYLHIMGLIIHGIVTSILYRTLRKQISFEITFLMCLFFFTVRPKELPLPEFSNMSLWFSVLMFCCLVSYFREQNRKWWLLLTCVCLCLQILSYPACLIMYFPAIYLLAKYSTEKQKDILLLTLGCMLLGVLYLSYFLIRIGISDFGLYLRYILASDSSHASGFVDKIVAYGHDIGIMAIMLAVFMCLSIVAGLVGYLFLTLKNRLHKRKTLIRIRTIKKISILSFFVLLLLFELYNVFFIWNYEMYTTLFYSHSLKYIPIIAVGYLGLRFCNREENQIVRVGMSLGIGSFIATILLSNLFLFASLNYILLGGMVAMIPIAKILEKEFSARKKQYKYGMLILLCLTVIIRKGFILQEATGASILGIGGIVKSGPAMGFVSSYISPYIMNTTVEEWGEYIMPNDRVLLATGQFVLGTLPYLYEDVEISVHSTICTPTFDETLLHYWELNPHKRPNVVVVSCWYGNLNAEEDSWIMKWIENEFQPSSYVDGSYWRFYRLEEE